MTPDGPVPLERPVGERLFEIAPGVYRIPLPTTFAVGDVNAYFLDGARPTLIDTGIGSEPGLAALGQALGLLGRRVEDLSAVLLTHTHVDHAGNIAALRERAGCEVRVMARGVTRLQDVKADVEGHLPAFRDFLRRSGFSPETVDNYAGMSRMILRFTRSCPDVTPLADGETLDLGDRALRALWRPGHSSVDTVYLLKDARVLFTGDHVLPNITPNPTLEAPAPEDGGSFRALVRFRESLARTATLDVGVACPGHGRPFGDLARRCQEQLAHQDRRCRLILKIVREAGAVTRKDVSLALFGQVRLWDIFLTLSEVQGGLEVLEAEGSVRAWNDGSVDRFQAV